MGRIAFEEFNGTSAETDGALEIAAISFRHFEQGLECWDIATLGCFLNASLVFVVVVVVVVGADVEEAIAFQMDILMDFKV